MNHIEVYDDALSKEGCDKIIEYFENSPNKEDAVVMGDSDTKVRPEFKKGKNISVRLSDCDKDMYDYLITYILPALSNGLKQYKEKYPFLDHGLDEWSISDGFNIQKFDGKKEGYFCMHCESCTIENCNRMLVWMIYLNNAKCGTRFYYPTRDVKAKKGRLVLWPAGWTHPHSGILPNIGEKYMITGWYGLVG
tara:strand:- start:66 stop:644 length:579 start_codon:yes stop_codon:yes gene_type:complete